MAVKGKAGTQEKKGNLLQRLLRLRIKKKSRQPDFNRQEGYRYKRLKDSWRRPRGRHSKLRKSEVARGSKPGVGYMSPAGVRGLSRKGLEQVYVSNPQDIERLDPGRHAAIIRSGVGRKKRGEIITRAEHKRVTVLNAYKYKLAGAK